MEVTHDILRKAKQGDAKTIVKLMRYVRTNPDSSDVMECYYQKYSGSIDRDDVEYLFDYHFSKTINQVWWQREGRDPSKFKAFILNLVYKGVLTIGKKNFAKHIKNEADRPIYLMVKRSFGTIDVHEHPEVCGCINDCDFDLIDAKMRYDKMMARVEKPRVRGILKDVFTKGLNVKELAEKYGTSVVTIRSDIKSLTELAVSL